MTQMSKKEKVEVKGPEEKEIETWYPSDPWQAFNEMMEDFRMNYMEPWWPRLAWRRPFRMRGMEPMMRRAARVDLRDAGKEYEVYAELPGIPKDNVDITVTKNGIEIDAKAGKEAEEERKGYVVRERSYREFHRRLPFPEEVVPDKAEATMKDGLLEVKVPKKTPTPEEKGHPVKIK